MHQLRHAATAGALLALSTGGCSPPRVVLEDAEISALDDLTTLMDAQATAFDPRYDLAVAKAAEQLTPDDLAELASMAHTVTQTAGRLGTFAAGRADFAEWASQLTQQARQLTEATAAADAATSLDLVRAMKRTCKACHDVYY